MKSLSAIWGSILGRGDSRENELTVSNGMLQSAATGDVAAFRSYLSELYSIIPKKIDVLLMVDGNGWTALQLGAATNRISIVEEILQSVAQHGIFAEPILDFSGDNAMTALVLALNNDFPGIAKALIDSGASLEPCGPRDRNCVFLICRGGHLDILQSLVHVKGPQVVKDLVQCKDTNGYTALHAAAIMGHAEVCALLIELGLDITQATRDRSNALHIACRNLKHSDRESSRLTVAALLKRCPENALTQADTFGSSPLHVAMSCANIEAVKCILCRFPMDSLICQDNDGLHPSHAACQNLCSYLYQRNSESDSEVLEGLSVKILDAVCCVQEVISADYPLEKTDYSTYTILHTLCSYPYEEVLQLVGLIIDTIRLSPRYSDVSISSILEIEAANGLTCLHNVYQNEGPCKGQLINLLRKHMTAEFLRSFNEYKIKKDNKEFRNRCGAHNLIPLEVRRAILDDEYSVTSVARRLRSLGRPPRIVALIGAGISTSAGIPDFRSDNGLYSNKATSNMFSVQFLMESPSEFYGRIRDMFIPVVDGDIKLRHAHKNACHAEGFEGCGLAKKSIHSKYRHA